MIDIFRCYNVTQKHASVFLDQKLEKYGLYSCHRIFIKRIASNPGITRDQMKNIAHVHPSNTTRAIDYLEEKGFLIKSVKEEDKRICQLFPTDKLLEVYDVLVKAEQEWIDIITEGFSEEELENFKKYLNLSTELSVKYIHKEK